MEISIETHKQNQSNVLLNYLNKDCITLTIDDLIAIKILIFLIKRLD